MAQNIPMVSFIVVKKCSHPDNCLEKYFSNGYCRIHYNRIRKTGEVGDLNRTRRENRTKVNESCMVEGCIKLQKKYGFCTMHHSRFWENGDTGKAETLKFIDTAPEGYKTCQNKDCEVPIKTIEEFHTMKDKRTDKYRKVSYCRICTREEIAKRNYKLSKIEFRKLLNKGKCEICYKPTDLVVDHCHKTGKVRGLLCNNCNRAIGLLGDNVHSLFNAWLYVKENS